MGDTRRQWIARCATSLAGASALGLRATGRASAQGAPVPLTIVQAPTVDATAFYYGVKAGIFEKAGLDLTVRNVTSGSLGTVAIVGGDAQIGLSNTLSLAQAHEKGVPLTLVFGGGVYDTNLPIAKIYVAADGPIKAAKDLEDKVIAVSSVHDLMALAAKAWLASEKVDMDRVKFLEIPQSAMAAALEQKRVDAISQFEPFASGVEATGKARIIARPYDAIAKQFQVTAWYVYGPWLAAHKDAVVKFVGALKTATAYSNPHLADMIPIVAAATGLPPDVVTKALKVKTADGMNPAYLQPVIDTAARFGELKAPFPARGIILPPG